MKTVDEVLDSLTPVEGGLWLIPGKRNRQDHEAIRAEIRKQTDDKVPSAVELEELHGLRMQEIAAAKPMIDWEQYPQTTLAWVRKTLLNSSLFEVDVQNYIIRYKEQNTQCTDSELNSVLANMLEEYNNNIPEEEGPRGGKVKLFKPLLAGNIMHSIVQFKAEARQTDISATQERIRFNPDYIEAFDDLTDKIIDIYEFEGDRNVIKLAFKQFLWQVKRRVFGLPVKDHTMLSIYGKQGLGKSTLGRILGSFLGARGYGTALLSATKGNFDIGTLCQQAFIVDIEEMADPESKTDGRAVDHGHVAAIKKLVSGDYHEGRTMHSTHLSKVQMMASFICTTNYHFYDIVLDTGYRRFYELSSSRDRIVDIEKVNELEPKLIYLWKSVDESSEVGYLRLPENKPAYDKLQEVQKSYVRKSPFDQWVLEEYAGISCVPNQGYTEYTCKALHDAYMRWYSKVYGGTKYSLGLEAFMSELKKYGKAHTPTERTATRLRLYWVLKRGKP